MIERHFIYELIGKNSTAQILDRYYFYHQHMSISAPPSISITVSLLAEVIFE